MLKLLICLIMVGKERTVPLPIYEASKELKSTYQIMHQKAEEADRDIQTLLAKYDSLTQEISITTDVGSQYEIEHERRKVFSRLVRVGAEYIQEVKKYGLLLKDKVNHFEAVIKKEKENIKWHQKEICELLDTIRVSLNETTERMDWVYEMWNDLKNDPNIDNKLRAIGSDLLEIKISLEERKKQGDSSIQHSNIYINEFTQAEAMIEDYKCEVNRFMEGIKFKEKIISLMAQQGKAIEEIEKIRDDLTYSIEEYGLDDPAKLETPLSRIIKSSPPEWNIKVNPKVKEWKWKKNKKLLSSEEMIKLKRGER